MPTYNYHCDACGADFEKEQRISEDPIKKCAKCGRNKARRMIAGGNFILKGGGWYSDGYGSSKSSSSKGNSGGSDSSSGSSDSGSSSSSDSGNSGSAASA